MAESIVLPRQAGKAELYEAILPQIQALISHENDLIANLANISAVLKEAFGFFWVGFYLKKNEQLVLGPFQGPLACTRIGLSKGVCGHAYTTQKTVIVPDVEAFPGHIACSSASKSEIVVPIFDQNAQVAMVLDVDADYLAAFDATDQKYLESLAQMIRATHFRS